jgi:hypothetical protein
MPKRHLVTASLVMGLACLPLQYAVAAAPDIDAVCAATACRDGGYEIALRLDKGHYRTLPVTRSPYILEDGSILIFPGEAFAI